MRKTIIYLLFFLSPLLLHAREKVYSEKTFFGWAIFMIIVLLVLAIREIIRIIKVTQTERYWRKRLPIWGKIGYTAAQEIFMVTKV